MQQKEIHYTIDLIYSLFDDFLSFYLSFIALFLSGDGEHNIVWEWFKIVW